MTTSNQIPSSEVQSAFDAERATAGGRDAPVAIGGVVDAVVKFKQVTCYTTFLVEYACIDGDYVIHFFLPQEHYVAVDARNDKYRPAERSLIAWKRDFPQVLSPTAEQYFKASFPRVLAQYIPELSSWYMRARGFAARLSVEDYIEKFFDELDSALERSDFLG